MKYNYSVLDYHIFLQFSPTTKTEVPLYVGDITRHLFNKKYSVMWVHSILKLSSILIFCNYLFWFNLKNLYYFYFIKPTKLMRRKSIATIRNIENTSNYKLVESWRSRIIREIKLVFYKKNNVYLNEIFKSVRKKISINPEYICLYIYIYKLYVLPHFDASR